jgi:uncharacterized protein (TIGR03067 family)/prepilin-type processing-associated H-X9-DG protein
MFPTRARRGIASLLALTALGVSLGLLARPGLSAQDKGSKNPLDGTWTVVGLTQNGKQMPEEQVKLLQFKFEGEKITFSMLGKGKEGTFKADTSKQPKQFELTLDGKPVPGIYRLEKDTLTLCFAERGERPTEFAAGPGSKNVLLVLKRGALKVDAAELKKAVEKVRLAAQRVQSQNNLKQLGLTMHSYHDVYKHLPKAAIYSKDGKPLLSWRVTVLPFIEEAELFRQFKLDEPWDSPHNKTLLEKMPKLYEPVRGKTKQPYTTYYQVFTGPGTAFEDDKRISFATITDGTSNTIMIVEAGEAVPWTKPADLPYDPQKDLPKLGGLFPNGFNVALCDGSVRWVNRGFDMRTFRLAITRNDGQEIDIEKLFR